MQKSLFVEVKMSKKIDCKSFSDNILDEIAAEVKIRMDAHCVCPTLVVLTVGEVSSASQAYIRNKQKACERVGIQYNHIAFSEKEDLQYIFQTIERLNRDDSVGGIILQLPIQHQIINNPEIISHKIAASKDVDGFHSDIGWYLYEGYKKFSNNLYPCTALGVYRLLISEYQGVENLAGKNITIIGRSKLVGKPLALMLNDANCTVTLCHSYTKNIQNHLQNADIIISAIGKMDTLEDKLPEHCEMIIDVGINRGSDGKLHGDISEEAKIKCADKYTSVPGGVGLLTVAMLMENTWSASKKILGY
jgi:methylenetetrahydrofolate dehydrogenase (NADP+)/methenyltetrahydrofolate cyclohydrolase